MPDREQARERARELAAEFIRKGEPYRWFDVLYKEAERGEAVVPWDDLAPNPNMVAYWKAHSWDTAGQRALVVGCGLGDDSEQIAAWGFRTTAFDVSETAIAMAKKRFPESAVTFEVADLFAAPQQWRATFDFVFECNTVQALPTSIRAKAIEKIAQFVGPGGRLLVIARARDESDPEGQLPWPVTHHELGGFIRAGLREESFEDFADSEPPWTRRFCVLYRRP
jgi:2-polyprenyl-3-methyl-5-hydroxy-6-metoxy-1,4-benzoquinol methylase